jgi:DNA topoisomerase-1
MSDAKLERTNVKIEANNHSEILRLQVRCCFWRFSKWCHHDDDEEEQEGMLPAMKVSELHNNYITATETIFKTSGTLYRSSLVKNWRALSSVNLCAYYFNYSQQKLCWERKLDGQRENIQLVLQSGKEEKLLKENTGSDKGKLVQQI